MSKRAFIVRPFETQQGIDFDRVCDTLIIPALEAVNVDGRTTLDIMRAGNIRSDMFQRLLSADLVVADLSIHNANVFYELGIRHALRDKRTFLLRANIDRYPFDLQTDRYLTYNAADPGASVGALTEAFRQTLASERCDSPVFELLPNLVAQDVSRFLAVPADFREDVEQAAKTHRLGDLNLYADEICGLEWESGALRIVGNAQFDLGAWRDALRTWETVRSFDPNDVEANTWLGTVYQRCAEPVRSEHALRRVLSNKRATAAQRAEALSLLGRNQKNLWMTAWNQPHETSRAQMALASPHLRAALDRYLCAFKEDLNSYYPGVNALALLIVRTRLAQALPDTWNAQFDSDAAAAVELSSCQQQAAELAGALRLALAGEHERLARAGKRATWVDISEADRLLLTGQRPPRVAAAYHAALADATEFEIASTCRQLITYELLGMFPDAVAEALEVFPPRTVIQERDALAQACPPHAAVITKTLLFAGHRIDPPGGRNPPRFPQDKEAIARAAIEHAVAQEAWPANTNITGIAGGASGGDILFHETCAARGIQTQLYLPFPADHFCATSVADGGSQWIQRFHALLDRLPTRILGQSEQLPQWLADKADYDIWQRNNHWLAENALTAGAENATLIALWDGAAGEGPGGTKGLVELAQQHGMRTVILSTRNLFG